MLLLINLRCITFLYELKFFNLIVMSVTRLTKPFFGRLLFLYLLYMLFIFIGAIAYGGLITRQSTTAANPNLSAYYWLLNFNDFCSGLVVLFHIMVVNNWYVTTDMYVSVVETKWPIVFFAIFWVFAVLICLNIITASVIEIYSASEDVITGKHNFLKSSKYLEKRFRGMSSEEIRLQVEKAMQQMD